MEEKKMYDAEGNKIEIGVRYGYVSSRNGYSECKIGVAVRMTKERVTLAVEQKYGAVYLDRMSELPKKDETMSVKSNLLLRIYDKWDF
jgi:hypothetical protein